MSNQPDDQNQTEETRLVAHQAQKLSGQTQRIEIQRGNAWLSLEGEDIVLEPGESITIRSSKHGGVISAAGENSMAFTVSDLEKMQEAQAEESGIRLAAHDARKLDKRAQVIEVQRGNAWITLGDEDIVLKPGEAITIRSSKHSGVISAMGTDSMVFKVSDLNLDDD